MDMIVKKCDGRSQVTTQITLDNLSKAKFVFIHHSAGGGVFGQTCSDRVECIERVKEIQDQHMDESVSIS